MQSGTAVWGGGTNTAFGRHFCLSASDGEEVWGWSHLYIAGAYVLGSPTAVGGTLFVVSDAGTIVAYRDATPEEHALANVTISMGEEVRPGTRTQLSVSLESSAAIRDVSLRLTLPEGLRLLNETPAQAVVPRTLVFGLGAVGLGGYRDAMNVEVLGNYASWTVTASVTYRDFAGRDYPELETHETYRWEPTSPSSLDLAVVAGAAIATAAAVAVMLFMVSRRRGRKGEGPPNA